MPNSGLETRDDGRMIRRHGPAELALLAVLAIDHETTAKLLKSPHSGEGTQISGTFTATIQQFTAGKGTIIWTAAVDELTVNV